MTTNNNNSGAETMFIDQTGKFLWPDETTKSGRLMADVLCGVERSGVDYRISRRGDDIAEIETSTISTSIVNISAVKRGNRSECAKLGHACADAAHYGML